MSSAIVGHTNQRRALLQLAVSGKLATTLLFSGISGVGKSLVAKEIAKTLLCQKPGKQACGNCEYCLLFESGNHPDFFFVDCKESDVESLRSLLYSLNLKSFFGGKRVVIFNDADSLGIQSSNLLLKSLEEPRPDTYYILVAAHRGALPPTLVSRSQVWFFDRLADTQIEQLLAARAAEAKAAGLSVKELVLLADGSLGNIESLIQKSDLWRELSRTMETIASGKFSAAPELVSRIAKDKEHIGESLQLMRVCARSRMLESKYPALMLAWANCLTNLITAERLILERNLAAGTVLLSALSALHADAQPSAFTGLSNSARLLEKAVV